jgi:(E)-4-hydroxy-3-methylbut-2-enyl-diphosphate synthase
MTTYYNSLTKYSRIDTVEVKIGNRPVGGKNPIRLQSMTSIDTNNIEAVVAQTQRIVDAGGDYVRITAQGLKEAESLKTIKEQLLEKGYSNPLVADIHFNPKAAELAAEYIEKVRINPGNYVEKRTINEVHYTDEEYENELVKIRQNLHTLLSICKKNGVAIRIGVNHGSLSQRVMSRYGDTPEGLVMSLIEFLQICIAEDFHSIVLSIKASNTRVMVHSCRLLIAKMKEMGCCYPVHLGVTEAGEGEDGRLKSAIGIGTLLTDGIGDTVRVSLTEEPEFEIPVARQIVDYCTKQDDSIYNTIESLPYDPYSYSRRTTLMVDAIGGGKIPVVLAYADNAKPTDFKQKPDYFIFEKYPGNEIYSIFASVVPNVILPFTDWKQNGKGFPLFTLQEFLQNDHHAICNFIKISYKDIESLSKDLDLKTVVFILDSVSGVGYRELRAAVVELQKRGILNPIIIATTYSESNKETFQIATACGLGGMFIDGLADGICLTNKALDASVVSFTSFGILQASRVRFSKTEYISCPSCGRTLFDIQTTVKEIRQRTGHLPNLKIGVMGCIVNGPGEMADADYGYVGAGRGLITLYKEKEVVRRGVPANKAVDELIELIKEHGDWKEKNGEL